MSRSGRVTLAVALTLGAIACSGDDAEDAAPATSAGTTSSSAGETTTSSAPVAAQDPADGFTPEPLEFTACGGGLECAPLAVPLDYADPTGPTITLTVARRPADNPGNRIGSVLVNPGGPGAGAIDFIRSGSPFDGEIDSRFDVVAVDPRGVGNSARLTCRDAVAPFQALDPDPDTTAEQRALDDAARALADECENEDGELLPHLGTEDVVSDMEVVRKALGEPTLTFVGYSYGTLLGERYLERFPDRARAIVLDGVIDPRHTLTDMLRAQTRAADDTLDEILADCDDCPGGDGAAAYDEIARKVEADPLPAGGGQVAGPGELSTAAFYATYSPNSWPAFHDALDDALGGDGTVLRQLAEAYRAFGGFTAYVAVECVDSEVPKGSEAYAAFAEELAAISPRLGAAVANELLPCAFWTAPPSGRPGAIRGAGGPPVLVIGNTGDTATPYEQAEAVAQMLERAVLLTYEGRGHTSSSFSSCVRERVTRYLVDLELPPTGTRCS